MSVKRVAIDLDGIVANFVSSAIKHFQIQYPFLPNDWQPGKFNVAVDLAERFNINKKEIRRIMGALMASDDFWLNLEPHQENIDAIRENLLHDPAYEVFYLTSRPKGTVRPTNEWLIRYELMASNAGLIQVEHKRDKASVICAIEADFSIDDSLEVLEHTLQINAHKTFLLTRPWNIDTDLPVQRVSNLAEFVEHVKK